MSLHNKMTFLVVDDQSTMRKVIKNNLNQMGYDSVLEAGDGHGALMLLSEQAIDFVICDWNMPRMNGFELLTHLRNSSTHKDIPFMLVTAEAERESVGTAVAAGVDEFLIKPFTPATLREKVRRVLLRGHHAVSYKPVRKVVHTATDVMHPAVTDKKSTILVVDDTPTNIDVLTGLLSDEYRVLAATNGENALKLANSPNRPDLILLDIMMPEMDGMEVCRRLKDNPETESIPIIFLTGKTKVEDIASGLDAGAVDYITKPANPKILKARVRTHLCLKKARDSLVGQIDTMTENARLREDVERITRHDLKNPLAALINTSESLLENQWLGAEQKNEVASIRSSAYDILGMIERSLDLYKMETGQYQLNPKSFDIVAVTNKVVDASRRNARAYGISIIFNAPEGCPMQGEELLTFSMLGNLVKNAVEASPKKGHVTVTVECGDEISISIHNEGLVPDNVREHFFDKYVTSGKASGTGIGTYSAKLMAEVQGGTIAFESSANAGTTLTVRFPGVKTAR